MRFEELKSGYISEADQCAIIVTFIVLEVVGEAGPEESNSTT